MMTTIVLPQPVRQKDQDLNSLRGCVLYMINARIGSVNYLRCGVFGVAFIKL